ncbi:DUF4349 domain-containing protein [Ferruginibacter albus]|uniref:DUF4349 domain-containing protein n=1 Tax=Ferruginibacter albus TaxID=2875540 RepID=UPI001CC5DC95|nr:DUF4349 domain-containing protein [Ferruginibacter albus]UAY53615.1 DUF4349 domain-containing protein [Ferruginibacter albus]
MQTKYLPIIGMAILLYSCGGYQTSPGPEYSTAKATADSATTLSSSAAVEKTTDAEQKFIRTADIKFKVKDAVAATYTIEDVVNQQGGFVTYTNLKSDVSNVNSVQVNSDSTLETTHFTVNNTMTIRVPNTRLDTTLKSIASLVGFLDYRLIKADDVSLQLLSNDLTQKRYTKTQERLTTAIDTRGKKLGETANAEEILSDKQEQSDNAYINTLSLVNQIKYSTVTLYLYQNPSIKTQMLAIEKTIEPYQPGLGTQLLVSLKDGWEIIEAIVVFFVRFWGLILAAAIGWSIYRIYFAKQKIKV